ncbi:MAG: aspartate-semialdehyde dehydrogenase [bacterium]|nr:aspartate-semialdehyde dehydrogenase [bacterium]MDT8396123.1 aspartate-semialdehyde dehydrogenase [bacterium]
MSGKKFNVAIAGATGAVGELLIKVLEERGFPIGEMRYLASSRSVGKVMKWKGEDVAVQELTANSFGGIDIALFSAGGGTSLEFAPAAVKAGAVVVDNSSAFRMEPDIPLVVPEVNPEDIARYTERGIIANPNCTTIIMIVALKPLHDFAGIKRVVVSSYQSSSGAGAKAMEELIRQTRDWAAGKELTVSAFKHQLLFNVIPHIDSFTENGYTKEEMKMHNETRKMLHDDQIQVSATCVRVPVLTAHSEAVSIETERIITPEKARELFNDAPGVEVLDDPGDNRYPMPLFVGGKDTCLVGRIRRDYSASNGLAFWVVGDQLRKGAATNAVQIAEILARDYL